MGQFSNHLSQGGSAYGCTLDSGEFRRLFIGIDSGLASIRKGDRDMSQMLRNLPARHFAFAALIAVAVVTLCVSAQQLSASEPGCADYVCSASADCTKITDTCTTCEATSGGTKRCGTKVAED